MRLFFNKLLQTRSVLLRSRKYSTVKPKAHLDINYYCNPDNLKEIQENLRFRKNVHCDIVKIQTLYKRFKDDSGESSWDMLAEELCKLPNRTHPDIIQYADQPKIIKQNLTKQSFPFEPRDFNAIAENLNIMRNRHLGNLAGSRSYYFLGELAQLERALIKFVTNRLLKENFELIGVPDILPTNVVKRCGVAVDGERTLVYKLDESVHESGWCLSGTSEMALAGFLMDQVIPARELPKKLAAVSRCYRAETSNLVHERGLYRVHQFTKVEMFGVCKPQDSNVFLEEFRAIQEDIFKSLNLHFQVLDMPAFELGLPAYRKYDIEAWMPGKQVYGEISSCSNCTDYQARRLNIRYSDESNDIGFAHTINGTACAIPRMIIALAETFQQANGSFLVPPVLREYLEGREFIRRQRGIPHLKINK